MTTSERIGDGDSSKQKFCDECLASAQKYGIRAFATVSLHYDPSKDALSLSVYIANDEKPLSEHTQEERVAAYEELAEDLYKIYEVWCVKHNLTASFDDTLLN